MLNGLKNLLLLICLLTASPAFANIIGLDGETAPDITWEDSNGTTYNLSALRGQPVILHLWASWCHACIIEMPELAEWSKDNRNIRFIPLSMDRELEPAYKFLTSKKLDIPALLGESRAPSKLQLRSLPSTLLIDAEGRMVGAVHGAADWSDPKFLHSLSRMLNGN